MALITLADILVAWVEFAPFIASSTFAVINSLVMLESFTASYMVFIISAFITEEVFLLATIFVEFTIWLVLVGF